MTDQADRPCDCMLDQARQLLAAEPRLRRRVRAAAEDRGRGRQRRRRDDDAWRSNLAVAHRSARRAHRAGRCRYEPRRRGAALCGSRRRECIGRRAGGQRERFTKCCIAGRRESRCCRAVGRRGRCPIARRAARSDCWELDRLGRHADVVVLDAGSGLNHVVRRFWQAADVVLLVTTPDAPRSWMPMRRSRCLRRRAVAGTSHVSSIVPMKPRADGVYRALRRACQRFLGIEHRHCGSIAARPDCGGVAVARRRVCGCKSRATPPC